MDHIAIMNKSWGFLSMIRNGDKTIESRWSIKRTAPWNKVNKGDIIYFRNSGELVTIKAEVSKVLQYSQLNINQIKVIINQYGEHIGIKKTDYNKFTDLFKTKNYCVLIFIINITEIKPFSISKKGFGLQSSWLSFNNINDMKL